MLLLKRRKKTILFCTERKQISEPRGVLVFQNFCSIRADLKIGVQIVPNGATKYHCQPMCLHG